MPELTSAEVSGMETRFLAPYTGSRFKHKGSQQQCKRFVFSYRYLMMSENKFFAAKRMRFS